MYMYYYAVFVLVYLVIIHRPAGYSGAFYTTGLATESVSSSSGPLSLRAFRPFRYLNILVRKFLLPHSTHFYIYLYSLEVNSTEVKVLWSVIMVILYSMIPGIFAVSQHD